MQLKFDKFTVEGTPSELAKFLKVYSNSKNYSANQFGVQIMPCNTVIGQAIGTFKG